MEPGATCGQRLSVLYFTVFSTLIVHYLGTCESCKSGRYEVIIQPNYEDAAKLHNSSVMS